MHSHSSFLSISKTTLFLGCLLAASTSLGFAADRATRVFGPVPRQEFNGRFGAATKDIKALPTAGSSPWTMNMFIRPERAIYELTLIGGFGSARDETTKGTQRYIGRTGGGIHFWGGGIDVESDVPFEVGSWQMISATYDGNTVTLYKNGQPIESAPVTLQDAAPEVHLSPNGTWPGQDQHQFNGRIEGFSVWNTALSTSDIQAMLKDMPKK